MTKIEEVLQVLHDQPNGMTARDLHLRTGLSMNVLGTYLWELKRDGYVRRVGGQRGTYRYGLTDKGKDRIGEGDDPLRRLARAIGPDAQNSSALADFSEALKVIDRLDEYRTLKSFTEWLAAEHSGALSIDGPDVPGFLHKCVLEYLGVNADTYRQQSQQLSGLLDLMKDMP